VRNAAAAAAELVDLQLLPSLYPVTGLIVQYDLF
jgi:hypothetical protein